VVGAVCHDGQPTWEANSSTLNGTMPFTSDGPVKMYYESVGRGPAVLLILGQGMTIEAGWRTIDRLASRFRVLAFDNRGMGRSNHSMWPYLVSQMANDAVSVLDAAGEERAHVYGMSLGGMVAQEMALRHRERVRALVLGATTPGGPQALPQDPQVLTFFARVGAMAPEEAAWAAVPYSYGERTRRHHSDRIAEDISHRLRHPTDAIAYLHQVAAAASHSTQRRLGEIAVPTLVVHGEEDALQSPRNAHVLANVIPGAKLRMWPHCGHLYVTDEPKADLEIADFLKSHSPARRSATASGRVSRPGVRVERRTGTEKPLARRMRRSER
jgi:pimeloyl-ACP methyl ester carboxylesterase